MHFCGNAFINEDSIMYGGTVARDNAYITKESSISGRAVVMEDSMIQSGFVLDEAVVAGTGMVLAREGHSPIIRNGASVFGRVYGNVLIGGEASIIMENEMVGHPAIVSPEIFMKVKALRHAIDMFVKH